MQISMVSCKIWHQRSHPQQNEQSTPSYSNGKRSHPLPVHNANGKAAPSSPSDDLQSSAVVTAENHAVSSLQQILDPKSLATLENVKKQLNLSSDLEANRLLITLGLEKVKPLFADDTPNISIKDT